jgi:dTMP kinase
VLTGDTDSVSYLTLFRNTRYLKLFLAQAISSLGDWIGVIAIAILANEKAGYTGVGLVMIARVIPGFVAGPIAGVFADRFDRRRLMIGADVARAVIIFSLPFVPNLGYFLIASAALESLTLMWGPAKDASLPHVVAPKEMTRANSLNLLAVYGPWPLASILFAFMSTLGSFFGRTVPVLEGLEGEPEALALWLDSLTFCFSALMIWSLALPSSRRRGTRFSLQDVRRDLVEGLRFVVKHRQVRPWLLGVAFTFTAAGGVFSLGPGFVEEVLGGGGRGFALLIGFLGAGMIIGLLAVGIIARRVHKDVLFSGSILLLGVGLIGLASMSALSLAIPIASALGFFGGAAYSTGYSLIHETTKDELRGRTFSAAYTVIRLGTLIGLGLFPLVAQVIGNNQIALPGNLGNLLLPGSRVTLWLAGVVAVGGGLLSMRAIGYRSLAQQERYPGYFIVFEGGEGAGKSTQMAALARWLEEQGEKVLRTREPGGTPVGERLRDVLLDPEAASMDPRTEALLYAADRAQHVAEVVRPALQAGHIVVSDRFLDSSLAYQGLGRGLGLSEIYSISEWATGGLLPDLVFYLDIDPPAGLDRSGDGRDRIEAESEEFHSKVNAAYQELARRWPARFVVLDASRSEDQVHASVIEAYRKRVGDRTASLGAAVRELGTPGPPVAR